MAGHSQWANIKHRKGAQDAKRSKIFQKLSRKIIVAAKLGSPNPEINANLRLAIEKAKRENMPKENINKLLKKISNKDNNENFELIQYEGYGPYNVAIIVECLTDKRTRTAANIRAHFKKFDGTLAVNGSVNFLFDKKGILVFENKKYSEEQIWELALMANASNVIKENNQFIIETGVNNFNNVKKYFEDNNISQFDYAEITFIANQKQILNADEKNHFLKFIDFLEDDDDVQNVYHNIDF